MRIQRRANIFPYAAPSTIPEWRHRPLVSIVLPVYNHGSFVRAAIASVLQCQAWPLELVVIDDGSTDETPRVLAEAAGDSRMRIVRQENQGLARALNAGFELVTGSFVGWTSADNRYLPGALEQLASFLLANPSIGLVYGNVRLIDETGAPLRASGYRREDQDPEDTSVLRLPFTSDTIWGRNDNFLNACVLFREELRRRVGEHIARYKGFEDYDFWMRLALQSPLAHIDTDEPLYEYRLHRSSLTAELAGTDLSTLQQPVVAHWQRCYRERGAVSFSRIGESAWSRLWEEMLAAGRYDVRARKPILGSRSGIPVLGCRLPAGDQRELSFSLEEAPAQTLRHSSHSRYLCSGVNSVAVLSSPGASAAKPPASALLLPPLQVPRLFARARDSVFGAVSPAPESRASVLLFCSDQPPDGDPDAAWAAQALQHVITHVQPFTYVLFAETEQQRAFADSINLALGDNSALRIIDCSFQAEEQRQSSLLYVLSSIDVVLTLKAPRLDLSGLLELRIEAALAAQAGIGICCLTREPIAEPSTASALEQRALRRTLSLLPHLSLDTIGLRADDGGRLAQLLAGTGCGLCYGSLEQLLQSISPEALAGELCSFAAAAAGPTGAAE